MCDGPASIIRPDLPSHVPFEVWRFRNEWSGSPRTRYPFAVKSGHRNRGTFDSRTSLEDLSDRTRSATLNKNLCTDLRFWPKGFFRGSAPNLRVKSNRYYIRDHFRGVVGDAHNATFFLSNLVMDNISQVESHTDATPSTILL
jgi:hypothetical protein